LLNSDVYSELTAIANFKEQLLINSRMFASQTYAGGDTVMTSGILYVVDIPQIGSQTVTFNGENNVDPIFYWYCTTNLHLYNIDYVFENNATPRNVYVICEGSIYLYNSTNYGNFIASNYVTVQPSTIYGTVSCVRSLTLLGDISDNTDSMLAIHFTTECFVKGTKILTDRWYIPVEELRAGDTVMTYGGIHDNKYHMVVDPTLNPIVSIRKSVQKASRSASPIVFAQNAFAPNKPFDKLVVSSNHGIVGRNGIMYAANKFVNQTTIYQDPTMETITYYHLELAAHCAIMANGLLTETWREIKR